MKLGPELDRLIAEKVMGWRASSSGLNERGSPPDCWWDGERNRLQAKWSPSTNIAHAWEVVKKLRNIMVGPWGNSRWAVCAIQDGDWDCCDWFSVADTAPHAICLAALKSVGYPLDNADPKR